jgi:oligopeptide transport system substrate-binding protein
MRKVLVVGLAGLVFAIAACQKRESLVDEGIRTRTLLVGNQQEPANLDPQLVSAFTDFRIGIALFEGLTALDEKTAQPQPAVAERWDVSPDGLVYTFHLRSNAKWSNGERVTARDFAYSFQRILSPALGSSYAYMLWPIKNAEAFNTGKMTDFNRVGVTVIDDATLRVTLERPTAYLLALCAHSTWYPVPRATVEKFGKMDARENAWSRTGNLIGNGAFTLTEWRANARVVVTKNPHHWAAERNAIERVMFFPIEKEDAEEHNFRAGQLHVTGSIPFSKLPAYQKNSPELLRLDPLLSTGWIAFNCTKPPLNNPKVRRALAMAVDRNAISERIYHSSRLPGRTLVPPGCGGYPMVTGIPDDFPAARALLAEAGHPGGRDLPEFPMIVFNNASDPKSAEIIQAMWQRELGVKISIEPLEQKTLFQNQQNLAYTTASMGWSADFPDPYNFLEIFRSDNGNNTTGWRNPAYDKLLDEANASTNREKRFELLQRAESLLLEEAPIAPLFYGSRTYLIHPAVRNWQPSPLGLNRYQEVKLQN